MEDGGKSSSMKVNTSSMSNQVKHLMSMEEETMKEDQSLFGTSTTVLTRNGRSSTWTRRRRKSQRALIKISALK